MMVISLCAYQPSAYFVGSVGTSTSVPPMSVTFWVSGSLFLVELLDELAPPFEEQPASAAPRAIVAPVAPAAFRKPLRDMLIGSVAFIPVFIS